MLCSPLLPLASLLPLLLPSFLCSPSSLWQRNLNLVQSVSTTQRVEAGTSLQLECTLSPSLPPRAGLAWVKLGRGGSQQLLSYWSQQTEVEDYSPGFSGVLSGVTWSLHLTGVNTSSGGFYQCQALLEDEAVSTRKVLLAVLDPSKVEHNTKYVIKKQGGNVTLDCTDFNGEQDVTWQKIGDAGFGQSKGKQLKIIKVDREDSGVYMCTVTGGQEAMNVSLRVDHAPQVNVSEVVFQAPGYPASLQCRVAAVPVPAVAWYRGAEKITSNGRLSMTISDYRDGWMTCSLEFSSVSMAQYGNFSCTATNSHGTASGVASLEFSPIPILPPPPSSASHLLPLVHLLIIPWLLNFGSR